MVTQTTWSWSHLKELPVFAAEAPSSQSPTGHMKSHACHLENLFSDSDAVPRELVPHPEKV